MPFDGIFLALEPPDRRPFVVVLRALGLGDLLTAVPALRGISEHFGDHRKILAAPAALEGMAKLTGAVDQVVDAAPLAPLEPALSGADLAFNLHGRGPQSHRVLLESGPRRIIAFRHPEIPESAAGPEWSEDEHEIARWCRLLEHSGISCDPSRLALSAPRLPLADEVRGATVIHPGAASAGRRWPVERWAEVARSETAAGRPVVVTGGTEEASLGTELARRAGLRPEAVYSGRTDLVQLAAVVGAAGRVVCGDTGVAHLATALGTPSVVLFGPTSPAVWGPPSRTPWHRVIWKGQPGDPHAQAPEPGLLAIAVQDVIEQLDVLDDLERATRTADLSPGLS